MLVDEDVSDFLEHYGVKGMRWKFKKSLTASAPVPVARITYTNTIPAGQKPYNYDEDFTKEGGYYTQKLTNRYGDSPVSIIDIKPKKKSILSFLRSLFGG